MKKLSLLICAVVFSIIVVVAQTPEKINYQCVVRDNLGNVMVNRPVGLQVTLRSSTATGPVEYQETHAATTNGFGLITVQIGTGGNQTGTFSAIDWNANAYFIELGIDVSGGTSYTVMGAQQLVSVPYALQAKTAESVTGGITETDPVFGSSAASGINVTNISNWNTSFGWGDHSSAGYLTNYTETDPIFGVSPAYTISSGNVTDWNTAYSWGDHAAAGYLTNYTEADPIFGASPAYTITSTNVTNWTTAYSWGDHASAGYLTSFTELDPKVGVNSTNYLSKWNGTALVSSSIVDNGAVGIGTATPDASAKVEISSVTGGVLIPRMTTAQRDAIALPADGLQIYNTDIHCLEIWNTNGWMSYCGGSILFNGQAIIGCVPNTWTQKADLGLSGRYGAVSFSIGLKGYVGTGISAGNYTKDFWEFDPANNTWTQKADFGGTPRLLATGFSIGTKGYIGTGYDPSQRKDFWEYDPIGNTWTQKADFGGTAREAAVGFSIGAKGYIGVGNAQSPPANDFWEYDPGNNTWTQKANFGGGQRYYATGFSIGNKGYIGTGFNNNPPAFGDFWEYDPGNDTWTQKANFGGTARIEATGFSIGNKGYIGSGYDYTSATNDFWEYDPNTDSWTKKADFGGTARNFSTGFSIGTKGYMGTGTEGTDQKDFWEYCQ